MAVIKQPRLTIEQLRAEQVFVELTPKQKTLVENYISTNGDRVKSVLAAYETKSEQNARVLAYELFSSPRVVACLAAYFQSDPLESFKADVRKAYANKKLTIAQVSAMKLHAEINGWTSASLPNWRDAAEPTPKTKNPEATSDNRIPAGATPLVDAAGTVRGYRTTDGSYVRLTDEVAAQ